MKKLFIVLLTIVVINFVQKAKAQEQSAWSFGAQAGVSIPDLHSSGNNPTSKGYSSRLGPYCGIMLERKLSNYFALAAEVNYSGQGGKRNGMQAFATPDAYKSMFPQGAPPYLYANYKSIARLGYIEVPLLIKYYLPLNSGFHLFIDLGPYAALLANAKNVTQGSSQVFLDEKGSQQISQQPQSFDHTEDVKSDLHKGNVGIQANLGLQRAIGFSRIFIAVGGDYGLLNIQKDSSNGKNRTGAATLVAGYLISL